MTSTRDSRLRESHCINPPEKTNVSKVEFSRKFSKTRFGIETSRYIDSQIMAILNQPEAGTPAPALCREHGMSSATFYK